MCVLCNNGITGAAMEDVVRARVGLHGWTITGLRDGGFAYTVGLTNRGWPELVVQRMPLDSGSQMLFALVAGLADVEPPRAGLQIVLSPESDPKLGLPTRLVTYPGRKEDLDFAKKLFGERFSVLEVQPDTARFPFVK